MRWKQAALILPSLLAVVLTIAAAIFLLKRGFPVFPVQAGAAIICLIVYFAGGKWIERRSTTGASLRVALAVLAAGLLGGIALFAIVMGILWLVGSYDADGLNPFNKLGQGLVFALAIAVFEEIAFRGLLLRLCSKIVGAWAALLISAVVFGGVHALGSDAPLMRVAAIALTGGLLLGAAYTATGRLWLPIGLHWGWDFTEDSVFGSPVSGQHTAAGLISGQLSGPSILTGGSIGPDASLVAIIVVLAGAAYLLWRSGRLHSVEPGF